MKANRLKPKDSKEFKKLVTICRDRESRGKIEVENSWGFGPKDILIACVGTPIINMSETIQMNTKHGTQFDWQLDLTIERAREFREKLNLAIINAEMEIENYNEYCRRKETDGTDGIETKMSSV